MSPEASTFGSDQSVEELRRELAEAREQQAATAEILAAISHSPTDPYRVFAEMARSAARLCDAYDATIHQVDGNVLRIVAHHGSIPQRHSPVGLPTLPLVRGVLNGRAVLDQQTIQVPDLQALGDEYPEGSDLARRLGHRTTLAVPLIRAGEAIGAISMRRTAVRPFTDRQVQLLKTFADQAVIAVENMRLFESEQARTKELRESLEYRTATGDVLGIIAGSPKELQPVFDGIVATAQRLCETYDASIVLRDGDRLKLKAHVGPIPMRAEWPLGNRGLVASRSVMDKKTVHVHDLAAPGGEFPEGREDALKLGHRSILAVPLVLKGEGIGTMIVRRFEVRPFNDRQVELLKTFADQAVIAIENTRLFEEVQARTTELAESLKQQTATADVLKVISRSALDLQRVLNALVESAARLCNANDAAILQVFGDGLRLVAHHGQIPTPGPVGQATIPLLRGQIAGRAVLERRTIQVADIQAEADEYPESRRFALQLGYHTVLCVPLVHAGEAIGVILIRRVEVRPFIERQIEVVTTFADQAVIAIENTRLFEEVQAKTRDLQESLEYQTATSKVLGVISRSPTSVQPVFGAILDCAVRLCGADLGGICRVYNGQLEAIAFNPSTPEILAVVRESYPRPVDTTSLTGRAVVEARVIHVPDVEAPTAPASISPVVKGLGFRCQLAVPMLRNDQPIGVLALQRKAPGPFSTAQIELIRTFADQAVIAIENARLFEEVQARTKELQESLDRQTATSEVLGVISRSPNEVQPVLDTIVATAHRLCQAERAIVWRVEGETFRAVAHSGQPQDRVESVLSVRMPLSRGSMVGRATLARRAVQVEDVATDPELVAATHALHRAGNSQTILAVPLLLKGHPIGVITLGRTRVALFDDKQVALVESFADQAVIAVENSRLFEAEQASKRELTEALEQQTAT